jgi:flagellar biosynthesis protein FlhA
MTSERESPEPQRTAVDDVVVEWAPSLASLVTGGAGGPLARGPVALLSSNLQDRRARVSETLGFALPPICLRRADDLPEHTYRVRLRGTAVGEGVVHADRTMVILPGDTPAAAAVPEGLAGREPSFGMAVRWIDRAHGDAARTAGLTVVDAGIVLSMHVGELLQRHARVLFGREEALALLDAARKSAPRAIDAIVPDEVSVALFTRIARELVEEHVSVADVRAIVDALADAAIIPLPPEARLPAALAAVRRRLAWHIAGPLTVDRAIQVLALDEPLETALREGLDTRHGEEILRAPASVAHAIVDTLRARVVDGPVVVYAPTDLRRALFLFVHRFVDDVHVLTAGEIPREIDVVVAGRLTLSAPRAPEVA